MGPDPRDTDSSPSARYEARRSSMVRMRTAYREELDEFANDLIIMCDTVSDIMEKASEALLRGSLQKAEESLSLSDDLEEIRLRCEQRAVELLLLETPVATELRQVVSSIYIVADFQRMGALGMHIARLARRRHPEPLLPDVIYGQFEEMARLVKEMVIQTRDLLVDPDTDMALKLAREDDAVDELNHQVLALITSNDWAHTTRAAVDAAMLTRYFERYADHCVAVAARIVYLITGMDPDEYLDEHNPATMDGFSDF